MIATIESLSELDSAEISGQFYEEIEKLVDGLVEDIIGGHVCRRDEAVQQLQACVQESAYLHDDDLIDITLSHAADTEQLTRNITASGFLLIAYAIIMAHALKDLHTRPEFRALLQT